ncbi:MAG TPA: hypothetical protein VHT51_06860 [Micropepsaceae bacterium]|nr:hypothetical protein [Micropepsaceae bacterium]
MSTFVVFCCDRNYFPLAKGLVLSLTNAGLEESGIRLAFIDIGCEPDSVAWLRERGVHVLPSSQLTAIEGLQNVKGYHLAQICRPYLPRLFPEASAFIWLDSDLWVQSADTLKLLALYADNNRDKIFICPEWHYAYAAMNSDIVKFHVNNIGYHYNKAYGREVAAKLSVRPWLNTGVFAMAADNPLWARWGEELKRLYARHYAEDGDLARHMADGVSLNYLVAESSAAVLVDPLFNFTCMWALPYRDPAGVVRVPLPPNTPIGIVHLSMWSGRRKFYFEHGLLFQQGQYLSPDERVLLLP